LDVTALPFPNCNPSDTGRPCSCCAARSIANPPSTSPRSNYAKRQMTWFRSEPDVHWLSGFGDDPEIQEQAQALVSGRL